MSNFGFVQQTVPQVHDDCRRAEPYLAADPRTACFYARRAAEGVKAETLLRRARSLVELAIRVVRLNG